jgi:dUTP pyrophosphatase
MEKKEIEDYILKLKQLENDLNDDEDDSNFIGELDTLLSGLNKDIQKSYTPQTLKVPVKIKKLNPNAVTPKYSKDGDAGMDLTITEIISETDVDITYGFGVAMEIPTGYVGLVFPRSSIRKYRLVLTNSVGVIDSGYRGEIQTTFKKTNTDAIVYGVGERGAQIMIIPYPQIEFIETDELSDSERGDGGFGHTGK